MNKPIIGISTNHEHKLEYHNLCVISRAYIDAVRIAGGLPLLIPFEQDKDDLRQTFETIDALIIPGADDYHPSLYGQNKHEKAFLVSSIRQRFDVEMAEVLLQEFPQMPALAICGGFQLLNIVLGGTMTQHLTPEDFPIRTMRLHKKEPDDHEIPVHDVELSPKSLLNESDKYKKIWVRSSHHQAIADLADDLEITGKAPDGVIEAYEHKDKTRKIMAVQWHPELNLRYGGPDYAYHLSLFQKLVNLASQRKNSI